MSKTEDPTTLSKSAVHAIAELAIGGVKPLVLDTKEPGHIRVARPDGSIDVIELQPDYIADRLATPHELRSYIRDHRDVFPISKGIVIVSPSAVTYRFKFEDGRDQAVVPLLMSLPYQTVRGFKGENYSGQLIEQGGLYRALRVNLRGCVVEGDSLGKIVRNINWSTSEQIDQTISQANRTLGASLASKVGSKEGEVPEQFSVRFSLFDNFVHPVTIVCDLDPLPHLKQFRVTPYPGELERVLNETLEAIRQVFDATGSSDDAKPVCPAYIGA